MHGRLSLQRDTKLNVIVVGLSMDDSPITQIVHVRRRKPLWRMAVWTRGKSSMLQRPIASLPASAFL